MTFGSLFAGIGGFDLGFVRAGMTCAWQVEIDGQCNSVRRAHWPDVPHFKDVTQFHATDAIRPDIICGGFPCQDLSVAGRRAGLDGKRSGLWHQFRRVLEEFRPQWLCIENVPGLLSSGGGRDMATIVDALAELGYGWFYRVLDSQWFGVPQRRRRVFIVGCLGDRGRAAEVLFERESLPWDSPPRRQTGTRVAAAITSGVSAGGGVNPPGRRREDDVNLAYCLNGKQGKRYDGESESSVVSPIAHTLRSEGHDASEDGTGRGVPLAITLHSSKDCLEVASETELAQSLRTRAPGSTENSGTTCAIHGMRVRRLTPIECERLQGFPDNWTALGHDGKAISDSARYRMLGNAVTVNVAEWIGNRLAWELAEMVRQRDGAIVELNQGPEGT